VRFPRERLLEADEVFATSSIKEVFPVTRIDGKKIADGKPGPITRKLAQVFHDRILNLTRNSGGVFPMGHMGPLAGAAE